jgi:ferredoxin
MQLGFLAMTLVGVYVVRGNAERWCPFGGIEALYQYAREGDLICSLGVSNFYILAAVLASVLLLRRAFCGYACPIGTLSEWLNRAARRAGLPHLAIPYRLDRAMAALKYVALAAIVLFTWQVGELVFRGYDPCYALIGRHGDDITIWAYVIGGAIVAASLLIVMPFCRWLCPLAAVMSPLSRFAFARMKRNDESCVSCGACAASCPMGIRVDQVRQVTAGRCIACFECVDACPTADQGAIRWGPPERLGGRWPRWSVAGMLLTCITLAVAATYAFPLPSFTRSWGPPPTRTASLDLQVNNLTCRGRATLLAYFLERDDDLKVRGYVRIDAWPGTAPAAVRISYDPAQTNPAAIKRAMVEAYYDGAGKTWRSSPFRIVGYDPWSVE